jgi:hypothetical protein
MNGDAELLAALADMFDVVDPVPARLWDVVLPRCTDSAVMSLLSDTAMAVPAGMRGGGGPRTLRFAGTGTTVDLQLESVAGLGVRALGLVHPVHGRSSVVASWPGGAQVAVVDSVGWFQADVPAGPLRFLLRRPGLPSLATGWFVQ